MAQKHHTTHPDHQSNGTIGNGIKQTNVTPGQRTVEVPAFGAAKWAKRSADYQETLSMGIECLNIKDGQMISFELYQKNNEAGPKKIDGFRGIVSDGKANVDWHFSTDWWKKNKKAFEKGEVKFLFKCYWYNQKRYYNLPSEYSDELTLTATLKIVLYDDAKKPIANEHFKVYFGNDQVKPGKTDSSGKATLKDIPIGFPKITFPNNRFIAPEKPMRINSPLDINKFSIDLTKENIFYAGVIIKCKHKVDDHYRFIMNPPKFEVVQSAPEAKGLLLNVEEEPDEIDIYTAGKNNLTEAHGVKIKSELEQGLKKYSLEGKHDGNHGSMEFWTGKFWHDMCNPTSYTINGLNSPLSINAYSPDQYTLSISFPTPKPFQAGAKWTKDKLEGFEDKAGHRLEKHGFHYDKQKEKEQWGKLKHPLAIASTDRPLNFKVNDTAVELSALDALGSVILVYNKLNSIADCILQNLPKAGAYFTFKNEVLKGKFILKWGWKEYSDYRAFMGYEVSVEMTILSIEFEIGVGFSAAGLIGQIFGLLKGEVSVGVGAERSSPDMLGHIYIPFAAIIEAAIGARVKAGTLMHVEMKVVSALEIKNGKVAFATENPFSIEGDLNWTGIKCKITVSFGVGKSGGEKEKDVDALNEQATALKQEKDLWVLVEESNLGKFKFPSEEKYEPKYLASSQIRDLFSTALFKHEKIEIFLPDDSLYSHEKVLAKLMEPIDERSDLDRGEGKMKGIATAVMRWFKNNSTSHSWSGIGKKGVDYQMFIDFVRGKQYEGILDGIKDPSTGMKKALESNKMKV